MHTQVIPVSEQTRLAAAGSPAFKRLLEARLMTPEEWVEIHASGTLRKAKRIGMSWKNQHREERPAWEWGYPFELLPVTRVAAGPAIAASDCKAVTEFGWFLDRMKARNPFVEDEFEPAYLHAQISLGKHATNTPREGLAIVVSTTCAPWVPSGHIAFALVSTLQPDGSYSRARNPC